MQHPSPQSWRLRRRETALSPRQKVPELWLEVSENDRRSLPARSVSPQSRLNISQEQLKAEQAALDALKPGEDLVALQHAFDAADEAKQEEAKTE